MVRKLTDLDKKVLAKLDKASKITGDDVLHKIESSSEQAQERFRKTVRPTVDMPLSHKLEIALIIILVFLLGLLGLKFSALQSHHKQIVEASELRLGTEMKKASSLDRIIADLPSMDTMKTVLVDVSTQGQKIADIQNKLIEMVPPPPEDAAANRDFTAKSKELTSQMQGLIEKSTLDNATFPINSAWFRAYDTSRTGYAELKDPHSYKWVYPANYKIQAGSTNVVGVVWLCRDVADESKVYAWVTADYYPKLNKFAHLEFAKTAQGQALTPPTNEGPPTLKQQLDQSRTPDIIKKKIPAYIYNQYGDKANIPRDLVDWSKTEAPTLTPEEAKDQNDLSLIENAREQYRQQTKDQPVPTTIGESVPPNKLAPVIGSQPGDHNNQPAPIPPAAPAPAPQPQAAGQQLPPSSSP